jgi:hypothetical protein
MSDGGRDEPWRANDGGAAWEQLQSLLISGESLGAWALQHRLYALRHRRHLAAATSGRFIFIERPLLGGYRPMDVRWQDLKDARLTVGMISATITLIYDSNLSDTASGEGAARALEVSGLCKAQAQALYRECQAQGQAWREKRRVRSIEEMRAKAGGVQVATGVYAQKEDGARKLELDSPDAAGAPDGPAQRLGRAKEMLAAGLITDSEYEAIKARIVGAL